MNCLECQELLQRCLDGESAALGRDDFAAHLSVCPDCRDRYAAARRLLDGLRLFVPPQPPVGLAERICRQMVMERGRTLRFRRLLVTSAMTASLILTACAVYFVSRAVSPADAPPGLTELRQPPAPPASPSLHRSIEEAGLAVVALTRRTADETVEETKLLLPGGLPQASVGDGRGLERALEPPAQSLREIQQGMSAGLEPLTSSARRAVGFFLREIPPAENSVQ